ncbi:hypothetical protein FB451DRAFT_1029190 [Mycena latifolia]|nr:hypothetical protein FB451DRAFT_1029190 [Mycena latifolia]
MPPRPNPAIRPATISELAAVAQSDPDASPSSNLDLKHYLRRAESHRKTGTALASDLERAFIEYAQAATLIVEKIPAHREFATGLTAEQKSNLTAVSPKSFSDLSDIHVIILCLYLASSLFLAFSSYS